MGGEGLEREASRWFPLVLYSLPTVDTVLSEFAVFSVRSSHFTNRPRCNSHQGSVPQRCSNQAGQVTALDYTGAESAPPCYHTP